MPLAKGFVLSGVVPGVMYSDDDWGEWPSACLWREHLRKWLLSKWETLTMDYLQGDVRIGYGVVPLRDGNVVAQGDENSALIAAVEAVLEQTTKKPQPEGDRT